MVPLLGNLPNLLKSIDRHVEFAHEHSQKLDFKPYQVSLPFRAAVVHFSSPDILEHVLKTHFDNYIKGPLFFNLLNDLLGYGIFTVDGEAWKPQRKIASNIFTVSKFKTYVNHVFHSEMKEFISILDEQADKKTNLDLHDYFHRYTLDAFALIAFGVSKK
jgi:cytochrome P450